MNFPILFSLAIILAAPVRTVNPEATKNRKGQVSKQSKAKRTVKRRKGNIKRTNRRRHNQRYELQRRRKAGGTITRRRNSRATTYNNKQANKRSTNRVRKTQDLRHHNPSIQKKSKSSKGKRSARSPVHLSPLQKQMLMLQMEVLLSDPEMGPIYRQIIESRKKK